MDNCNFKIAGLVVAIDLITTIRENGVLHWWDEVNFLITKFTKVHIAAKLMLTFQSDKISSRILCIIFVISGIFISISFEGFIVNS